MIRIDITSNITEVLGYTARIHPQYRFAVALGLTRTAQAVSAGNRAQMPSIFDRPTPFTLNSLFVIPAKKDTLSAGVWLKDTGQGAVRQFLREEIFGGVRPQKKFEKLLQSSGIMPAGWVAVPGKGAKLNGYGNMSQGQLGQILSVLRAQGDPQQNTTSRSKKRARASGKSRDYFVSGPVVAARLANGGRLPFGIYQRLNGKVLSIMKFVPVARYKTRYDFFGISETIARRELPVELSKAWQRAIKTAK